MPAHREVVGSTSGKAWYVFKYFPTSAAHPNGPPEITGQDLNESGISADIASDSGQAEVLLSFKKHGAQEFQRITKLEYDRGRFAAGVAGQAGNNDPNVVVRYAGHNAIVLDGVLQSTPYIDYTDNTLSLGIAGGNARISMGTGGLKAAKDLALVLQSGSLPYKLVQVESTSVTATLGKSSLHQAILAAARGCSSSRCSCSCSTASSVSSRYSASRSTASSTTRRSSSSTSR